MKKLKGSRKQYLLKITPKKFRHELKRKQRRKELRYQNISIRIKNGRNQKFIHNYRKTEHKTLLAPNKLSLTDNPIEVISYFEEAQEALFRNVPVYFDLSKVNIMGPETLTYLCAWINEDKFTNNTALQGNAPDNQVLREMFIKAGFYKFVSSGYMMKMQSTDINDELIHKLTRKKVENDLAGEVCRSAMNHTFGKEDLEMQTFYPILIECMGNTWNHANYGEPEETYNWWLLAYKEPNTKITKFCFLDLGVGIFGSLEREYANQNLPDWIKWFIPNQNNKTLEKIFKGSRRTSTKNLQGRGLGLKNIYTLVKSDKSIRNFTLLSNDIIAKIGYNTVDNIRRIEKSFEGTLYYWELVPNESTK